MVLLEIKDLSIVYDTGEEVIHAVNDVSIEIEKGSVVSIVGESGSGKSTLAYSIIRLLPSYARVTNGKILFNNMNIIELSESKIREIRGKEISMIFQEPNTSLNPVFKIKEFMIDVYLTHNPNATKKEALERAIEMLRDVRIPNPETVLEKYPHELSGGMKQRVLIATALLNKPKLLLADEPTSALDVSVQAQILSLLKKLKEEHDMSILFITHNLAVAAQISDKVAVMYAGSIMEVANVHELFENPLHPYTRMLLKAIPRLGSREIKALPGTIPDLRKPVKGCVFRDRCPVSFDKCIERPPRVRISGREVYCWRYKEGMF